MMLCSGSMKEEQLRNDDADKILIVDDELFIRKVLSKYLSGKDYRIDTADDGRNAIEKLDSEPFDLVITDLRMPKMGGRELLQIMSENYPDIPKIVLTGHGTSDDIILALQTGAYDFLTKPITDFGILDHSIKRAIERKKLSDERKRYLEQANQINEIISMLNRGKSTEEIFNTLETTLKRVIPFNTLALLVINREEQSVTTKLVVSDSSALFPPERVFPLDDHLIEKIADSRELLSIDDITAMQEHIHGSSLMELLLGGGFTSLLMLPLIMKDSTRGFLLFAAVSSGVFIKGHVSFLESIVGQISFSLERGELIEEIEKHTKNLENLIDVRTKEILKTQKTTIFALSKIAETRDRKTGDHLERIRSYCVLLAQILKYTGTEEITSQFIRDLYDSSILHDIGKVGIPDMVLLKEGYLTPDEFSLMETHAAIGYEALRSASHDLGDDSFLKMALDITQFHHERWDGSGYPNGLKGAEIPLSARIVAIADVYDALTTVRSYKSAFTHERAVEILKNESHKFDPQLIKIFIDNADEFNEIRNRFESE
ncbi:MAG: response regulator [Chrysiogenales bacterium]|nr:MAG: response regulator [Chrysiogenales bacterium]